MSELKFILFRGSFFEWNQKIKQLSTMNWMQSWPFVTALHKRDFKAARCFCLEYENYEVGLCIINEINLGLIHFVEINRGPLLYKNSIDKYGFEFLISLFLSKIDQMYPKRFLRRRRFLFEIEEKYLIHFEHYKKRAETFSTVLLDLDKEVDLIKKSFKSKWRNLLSKSLNLNVNVKEDHTFEKQLLFLDYYRLHLQQKKYKGLSIDFVFEEFKMASKTQTLKIYWAYGSEQQIIAGIYILIHGHSATYRVAWNTNLGRRVNAHYSLIWHIILDLKVNDVKLLDMGGLLPGEADSIDHFKKGLNGKLIQLHGMFE